MMARTRLSVLLTALWLVLAPLAGSAESGLAPAPLDDDGRFTNLDGFITHGTAGVRFRFFLRRIAGSFGSRPGAPSQWMAGLDKRAKAGE